MNLLVINNAEKGITEFVEPITVLLEEAGVQWETAEYQEIPVQQVQQLTGYSGILLSGSPCGDDIVDHHQPWFQWVKTCPVPILGFCAGHHIIGKMYGSRLMRSVEVEIGGGMNVTHIIDYYFSGTYSPMLYLQNEIFTFD